MLNETFSVIFKHREQPSNFGAKITFFLFILWNFFESDFPTLLVQIDRWRLSIVNCTKCTFMILFLKLGGWKCIWFWNDSYYYWHHKGDAKSWEESAWRGFYHLCCHCTVFENDSKSLILAQHYERSELRKSQKSTSKSSVSTFAPFLARKFKWDIFWIFANTVYCKQLFTDLLSNESFGMERLEEVNHWGFFFP